MAPVEMPGVQQNGSGSRDANEKKVLIIGAGSTGLALAQGLKKASIPFTIYEKENAPTCERNWSMGLHWGLQPLRYLVPSEILSDSNLESTQVDPHVPTSDADRLPMVNGQTGEMIIEIKSSKFYRVRRDKFRRMLMSGIEIRWGKKIDSISYSDDKLTVTAIFTDGTSDTGLILIATDGPHSRVRTLLVGEEAAKVTPIDFASAMCFTQHTREHALYLRAKPHNPLYQVAPHPDGCCAWLSLHDGDDAEHPENWTFFHYISFPEPRDEINTRSHREHIAHQKAMARRFVDPWRSVFEWMPDDMEVWYSKLRNWNPSLPEHDWDNRDGRATLAGDAAHPMTFQRGQGLNHALQDAFTVCKAIEEFWGSSGGEGDIAAMIQQRTAVLGAYEAEMKARAGEEVRLSSQNSLAMHDWSLLSKSPSLTKGMTVKKE